MKNLSISLIAMLFMAMVVYAQDSFPVIRHGWPQEMSGSSNTGVLNNLAVYQKNDGQWIIAAATRAQICCFDINGTVLPGWPVTLDPQDTFGLAQGPRIGDMDGDGSIELVCFTADRDTTKHIRVYREDGLYDDQLSTRWYNSRPQDYLQSCPIFVDIDNDQNDELLYLTQDSLYAIDGNGDLVDGFPWHTGEIEAAANAGIVVGVGQGWNHDSPLVLWGTKHWIHARFLGNPNEVEGWPVEVGDDFIYSALSLFTTRDGWVLTMADDTLHYAWTENGAALQGFPVPLSEATGTSRGRPVGVIVSDMNGDGTPELLKRFSSQFLIVTSLSGSTPLETAIQVSSASSPSDGASEPPSVIQTNHETMAYVFTQNWRAAENDFCGLQFDTELDGFPIIHTNPNDQFTNPYAPTALIPGADDTLHIVYFQSEGFLAVYDYYMGDTGGMILEWPMPGNTPGGNRFYHPVQYINGVEEQQHSALPSAIELEQPYPNPFNATTRLAMTLPHGGGVLSVEDVLGRQLFTQHLSAGHHTWIWSSERSSFPITSGTYFIRVSTPEGEKAIRKVTLVK